MTLGEKMVWAAGFALAISDGNETDHAFWIAASCVLTARSTGGRDHVEATDNEVNDMRAEMLA
jgi:hypothetical protein